MAARPTTPQPRCRPPTGPCPPTARTRFLSSAPTAPTSHPSIPPLNISFQPHPSNTLLNPCPANHTSPQPLPQPPTASPFLLPCNIAPAPPFQHYSNTISTVLQHYFNAFKASKYSHSSDKTLKQKRTYTEPTLNPHRPHNVLTPPTATNHPHQAPPFDKKNHNPQKNQKKFLSLHFQKPLFHYGKNNRT